VRTGPFEHVAPNGAINDWETKAINFAPPEQRPMAVAMQEKYLCLEFLNKTLASRCARY
jgi:hypothetical protein